MARISWLKLLTTLLLVGLGGAAQSEGDPRNKAIRLHYPIISGADDIEALRPVAATPNIPVYEDKTGRRFLAGIDFAPFVYAWLEGTLTKSGFAPQPPSVLGAASASAPGLLLELRDLRVDLATADIFYVGTITVIRPNGRVHRHEFKTSRWFGDCEEGRMEPHVLISHNFEPLLTSLRNHIIEDLTGHMVAVDTVLADGRVATAGAR